MKIKTVVTAILFSLPFSLFAYNLGKNRHIAICSHGEENCKLSASGTINLIQARTHTKTKDIFFTLNDQVKGVLRLYYSQAKNQDTIKGEFIINSNSPKKTHIHYRVVFKDKVGVVAQSKGDLIFSKGKYQKMKFGSVVLTKEDMKNINIYNFHINTTK